ncbi:rhomboid family intramembrane serine protease [Candidatus Woesearchaeota archaeon]|nr:rhomboid family intramembrane serine protease [Candidatus Woesearchaeota archaeon]
MKNRYYALKITVILVLIFIIQLIFKNFTELFVLNSSEVFSKPWTLITSIFLHGSLAHLMLNGFALALFGSILENLIGSKKFLFLFFIGGIFANIPGIIFYNSSLGASGAIFGVLGTLTVLRPKMTIWMNFMPIPMWLAGIIWAIQDTIRALDPLSNIGSFAHLGGLFFGLVYGFYVKNR